MGALLRSCGCCIQSRRTRYGAKKYQLVGVFLFSQFHFSVAALLVASFLFLNLSWSAECLPPKSSVIESIEITTPDGSCRVALDMAERLTQISADLKRPIKLAMRISAADNNAGFDGKHTLIIPSQYVYQTPFNQITAMGTVVQLEVIVVHEFGHALLDQALQSKFPNGLDQRTNRTFVAYSELFADTIAVYTYNDPSAIMKALYFDELDKREFKLLQLRDFKIDHDINTKELDYEDHLRFAPVRSFIGKHMMPKNRKDKQRFIEILTESIIEAATAEAARSKPSPASDANVELISLLRKRLY